MPYKRVLIIHYICFEVSAALNPTHAINLRLLITNKRFIATNKQNF